MIIAHSYWETSLYFQSTFHVFCFCEVRPVPLWCKFSTQSQRIQVVLLHVVQRFCVGRVVCTALSLEFWKKVSQQHQGKFHFVFSPSVLFLYLLGVYGTQVCGCTQTRWCHFKCFNRNHSKVCDHAQKAILQLLSIANLKSSVPFLSEKHLFNGHC